jgi:hypothetical protein
VLESEAAGWKAGLLLVVSLAALLDANHGILIRLTATVALSDADYHYTDIRGSNTNLKSSVPVPEPSPSVARVEENTKKICSILRPSILRLFWVR